LGTLIDFKDNGGVGPNTAAGLIISNGSVTATSIAIQNANSGANMNLTGGSLTIGSSASTGAFKIGNNTSSTPRGGWLTMSGGSLTYLGTDGLLMGTVANATNSVNINGPSSVATLTGITLNQASSSGNTMSSLLVSNGATLYLGGAGLVINQPTATVFASIGNGTATIGAIADWSSVAPLTLAGNTTFKAADASSIAHNISLGGVLSGAGVLTKTGSGTLTISGNNTYNGGTTISHGTLLANNVAGSATGTGLVTVAGGTLAGTGIISSVVSVNAGGVLAPGNPFGTLTVSNNLTLSAGSTNFMQVQHSPLTNNSVKVTGILTEGGTLNVTNLGGTALAAGDTFTLFNAASYNGAFANVILPSLPVGLAWNTNNLNTAGTLSVVVTAKPVIGTVSISGGGLALAGTGGVANASFYLLGSTNLSTPVSNWTRLLTNQFDNSGNFNFTNGINSNTAQSFYLLQLQ
jgi:autotransporter-associated beta strand protein